MLFLRQRNIVGGDFLFLIETDDGFLLAVIDCEGHGVSGALMTMMADSILRHTAAGADPRDPAHILEEVERAVGTSLGGGLDEERFTSGFDIGLCACFPREGTLTYAGAGMPLYVREETGAVTTIAGRRRAVRSRHRKPPERFENHTFTGDRRMFFMLTDGFVDQAGGESSRGYGTRRLYELLRRAEPEWLDAAGNFWQQEFDAFRGEAAARDDVLAIAFTLEADSTENAEGSEPNG
jgi:serine phosphatase RsbU (regulator of sigma subunit)